MSGLGIIQEESPQACEICFVCASKDLETTKRKMAKYLFGVDK